MDLLLIILLILGVLAIAAYAFSPRARALVIHLGWAGLFLIFLRADRPLAKALTDSSIRSSRSSTARSSAASDADQSLATFAYREAIHTSTIECAHPNGNDSTPTTIQAIDLDRWNQTRQFIAAPARTPRRPGPRGRQRGTGPGCCPACRSVYGAPSTPTPDPPGSALAARRPAAASRPRSARAVVRAAVLGVGPVSGGPLLQVGAQALGVLRVVLAGVREAAAERTGLRPADLRRALPVRPVLHQLLG